MQKDEKGFFYHRFKLRDFYHFIRYFRRKASESKSYLIITPEIVLQSLERNFNGVTAQEFAQIVQVFFNRMNEILQFPVPRKPRNQLDVLRDSLADQYRFSLSLDLQFASY
ncbi:MAG TPA: hypothetical protein VIL29_00115 [Pseudothermotoga sp.]